MKSIILIVKKIKYYLSYLPYILFKPKIQQNVENPKLIVSLTSYPERIRCLPIVCGSLMRQTVKPDAIMLYLSKEQFKDEKNLILKSLKKQGVTIIMVNDDIKSHKKYFYCMQEFKDSIIITVDDDVIYDKCMVEDLYESYLRHPLAVSAKRVHGIRFDHDNKVLPYNEWEYQKSDKIDVEDFLLIATGCGGVLYPPHILDERSFNSDAIKRTCLQADDLWLKVMELENGVPVVLAKSKNYKLRNVWGTLANGLAKNNVEKNRNDQQLQDICSYLGKSLFDIIAKSTNCEK